MLKVTFLGTGTSHGIPMIACDCPVCKSTNKKNKRFRPSVLLEFGDGIKVLIDTAPELRLQCLANNITHVDAVLFTHQHNDHIAGLDDIRRFNQISKKHIHCFANRTTAKDIRAKFRYVFTTTQEGGGKPKIVLNTVSEEFKIGKHTITPLDVWHGRIKITGYRVGDFAYITDCSRIMKKTYPKLENLHTLVIGALRYHPHPTHFTLDQALAETKRINPKHTYLTHIAHNLEHETLLKTLPKNIQPAFDGLNITIP